MPPAMSAALVCAPPLIDWRSTSRPLSLKMPFSNAYHGIQSSALMLLYAETTFVQHGRGVVVGDAAACVGVVLAVGVPTTPPPQAVVRIARLAIRTARVLVMSGCPPFPLCRESSLDLRSPRLESVLDALEDRREQHPRARDEDHARQHLGRLQRLARDRDELADAVLYRDQLRDHDARERVADAQTEPGEDERYRAGKHHAAEDERVRRAERS